MDLLHLNHRHDKRDQRPRESLRHRAGMRGPRKTHTSFLALLAWPLCAPGRVRSSKTVGEEGEELDTNIQETRIFILLIYYFIFILLSITVGVQHYFVLASGVQHGDHSVM